MATTATQKLAPALDNFSKGGLFEWYVVRLFNRQHFSLEKWRRSKKALSPQDLVDYDYPDLEWELVFSGTNRYRFAVECKWRDGFRNGKIEWASPDQIGRYCSFQARIGITVFVVIGVGGQPGSPEQLFVTPLDEIKDSCEVGETQLRDYRRKARTRFYYDYRQLWLF